MKDNRTAPSRQRTPHHLSVRSWPTRIRVLTLTLCLLGLPAAPSHAQEGAPAGTTEAGGATVFLPTAATVDDVTVTPPVEPNPPTEYTAAANRAVYDELPFDDTSAFADVIRDLIAPLPSAPLVGNRSNAIWNPAAYDFIETGSTAPDSVNPSLWRQAQLVNTSGLFKVTDRLYQVRNYDLSNLTIIEGDTGLIIVDPLVSVETAQAGLALYLANRPAKPVVAVIYTHSHVDHWGGVLGVTTAEAVANGDVEIYAPEGFLEAASKENV